MPIFGCKLPLLVPLGGMMVDYVLAPAHVYDLTMGQALLSEDHDWEGLADKAYIRAPLARRLAQTNQVRLHPLPRANQKIQLPPEVCRRHNRVPQIMETVNGQWRQQFQLETNHAHRFWGLSTRLQTKLAAPSLSILLNRLLGNSEPLHIKALAFPN